MTSPAVYSAVPFRCYIFVARAEEMDVIAGVLREAGVLLAFDGKAVFLGGCEFLHLSCCWGVDVEITHATYRFAFSFFELLH